MTATRILLIEDDDDLRQMYTLIFTKAGYQLETANDGVQGLTNARAGGYQLILLDLMMPKLDGIGFLKELKKHGPKKPNGPIVILSNAGYNKVAEEAMTLGAQGFLLKADLLPHDLVKEVEWYLHGKK